MTERIERRRLADAIRKLSEQVVGSGLPDVDYGSLADAVEGWTSRLEVAPRRARVPVLRDSGAVKPGGPEGDGEAGAAAGPPGQLYDHGDMVAFSPLSGGANPVSVPFEWEWREDALLARVRFPRHLEGPPGHVHGGYIAAVFDEAFGAAQALAGLSLPSMTAQLTVRYLAPCPLGVEAELTGRLARREGRRIELTMAMEAGGRRVAEGEALMVTIDPARFQKLAGQLG